MGGYCTAPQQCALGLLEVLREEGYVDLPLLCREGFFSLVRTMYLVAARATLYWANSLNDT
jgi:hypothetical protein